MNNKLTAQERIWLSALENLVPKIKALGWKPDFDSDRIEDNNTIVYCFLAKNRRDRHYLRINKDGVPSFGRSVMICR